MPITFLNPEAFGLTLLLFIPKIYQHFTKDKKVRLLVSHQAKVKSKPILLFLRPALDYLNLIFLIFALARPIQLENNHNSLQTDQSILVLIDLSLSMNKFQQNTESNLEFLTKNVERTEMAWAGFASDCYLISPFTTDKNYLLSQIKTIDSKLIGTGKSAVGDAILAGILFFKKEQLNKKIILLSDMIINDGKVNWQQAKHQCEKRGVELFFVDVSNIPKKNKNVYKFPMDSLAIKQDFLIPKLSKNQEKIKNNQLKYKDLYIYFIWCSLVLFVLSLYLKMVGVDNVWKE